MFKLLAFIIDAMQIPVYVALIVIICAIDFTSSIQVYKTAH